MEQNENNELEKDTIEKEEVKENTEELPKSKKRKFLLFGCLGCGGLIAVFFFLAIIGGIIGSLSGDDNTNQNNSDNEAEINSDDNNIANNNEEEQEQEDMEVELDIVIEVTETEIDDEKVTVKGTTNLIDGAFLSYQIKATEGNVKIKDSKWEVTETIKQLEKDDENNVYGDGSEYNFFITFPAFGVDEEQSEEIVEIYGGTGATNITGGPNFYESEDGTLKTVSLEVDFDKDGIIDPEDREKRDFEQAVKDWDNHFKEDMLEHYGEAGVIDIRENPGSDWDVVNVYVPNEFKLSSEEEKRYYVEEIGPLLEADLSSHFKKDHDVHVYFLYEDNNTMASRKMFGGWKIK